MLGYVALFVVPLLKIATATFTPSVSVTCAIGPSYTVSLTSGSTTGVIFIDGQCAAQSTAASGSYTFDAAACTAGTVPALGTEFKLVVQEYSTINLATDYIVKVTCNLDTSSVEKVVTLGTTTDACDLSEDQQQELGVTCSKAISAARSSRVLLGIATVATIILAL